MAFFRWDAVDGDDGLAVAAFEGLAGSPVLGEEVLEAGDEEGAEFAARSVEVGQAAAVEQIGEELLGEVFGVFRLMALASDVGVDGRPVGGAKAFEGGLSGGGRTRPGLANDTPLGRTEVGRSRHGSSGDEGSRGDGGEASRRSAFAGGRRSPWRARILASSAVGEGAVPLVLGGPAGGAGGSGEKLCNRGQAEGL